MTKPDPSAEDCGVGGDWWGRPGAWGGGGGGGGGRVGWDDTRREGRRVVRRVDPDDARRCALVDLVDAQTVRVAWRKSGARRRRGLGHDRRVGIEPTEQRHRADSDEAAENRGNGKRSR